MREPIYLEFNLDRHPIVGKVIKVFNSIDS